MRVRIDRYSQTTSSLSLRSWLYAILGTIAILLGTFGGVIGLLILLVSDGDLWERRSGFFLTTFTGIFPLAIGGALIWRTVAARRNMSRLRDLAALARQQPVFAVTDVQRALDLGPMDAQRLLIDAAAWNIIDDFDPPQLPQQQSAYAATTPSPASGPLPNDPAQWVGAVLSNTYAIEKVIGSGGMGIVLAARHIRTGRKYAVKTLLPDARVSEEALRRFEREATAASAIGHPNIIAVHDYNVTESGVHYIVLDLLEGETLEGRLARVGSLPWDETKMIALEIGSALVAAHERGLLHRDLKPQNVFIQKEGNRERAVLLDFGLVKSMDDAVQSRITVTGAVVGTPLYMSPEQARGDSIDLRSDIYALGAVVFEMVTGAPPFIDRTLASVYARLLTTPPPNASSLANKPLPPALDAALAKALAKAPSDRYPTAAAFVAALEGIDDLPPNTVPLPRTA